MLRMPSHRVVSRIVALWTSGLLGCASHSLMTVNVPVSDLRATPKTQAVPDGHDPLQETQLLYGERVRALERRNGWTRIEAVEQPEFTHANRWQGYPGWVPTAALSRQDAPSPTIMVTEKWAPAYWNANALTPSPWRFAMGTRLQATAEGELWRVHLVRGETVWIPRRFATSLGQLDALPSSERRREILRRAEQLLGDPYYWGGRSPRAAVGTSGVTGVDCSGLVNLAYRAAGVTIPRDAHEQSLRARAVQTLEPADLVFLSAPANPRKIVHVMLYAGDDNVIEAPGTGLSVRRISLQERLGRPLKQLHPGLIVNEQRVSFGSYLSTSNSPR